MTRAQTGHRPLANGLATSALSYGHRLALPEVGALAVVTTRVGYAAHVGFVANVNEDGSIELISGDWAQAGVGFVRAAPLDRGVRRREAAERERSRRPRAPLPSAAAAPPWRMGANRPSSAKRGPSMETQDLWRLIRDQVRARRAQLRFCLRMTVAGLLALAVVNAFDFPLHGLWAVLTAIVVTQTSIGGSLRATIEYMVGTLGGAVYAAALGVLLPHATPASQAVVLALAIAPLALAAAINPSFRVAPFSAVLVLLIGGAIGESPINSALTRILEVALGGVVAVAVSVLVLPERAHRLGLDSAVRILDRMAGVLPEVLAGFSRAIDEAEIGRLVGDLGGSVTALQEIAAEAARERMIPFAREPDPAPLARNLLRLRHDLVILRRAAAPPLPEAIARRLDPPLTRLAEDAGGFLRGAASALAQGRPPPPLDARRSVAERLRFRGRLSSPRRIDARPFDPRSRAPVRPRLRARAVAPESFRSRAPRAGIRRSRQRRAPVIRRALPLRSRRRAHRRLRGWSRTILGLFRSVVIRQASVKPPGRD